MDGLTEIAVVGAGQACLDCLGLIPASCRRQQDRTDRPAPRNTGVKNAVPTLDEVKKYMDSHDF